MNLYTLHTLLLLILALLRLVWRLVKIALLLWPCLGAVSQLAGNATSRSQWLSPSHLSARLKGYSCASDHCVARGKAATWGWFHCSIKSLSSCLAFPSHSPEKLCELRGICFCFRRSCINTLCAIPGHFMCPGRKTANGVFPGVWNFLGMKFVSSK